MISFIHDSEQFFDTAPAASTIHKAYMQLTETRLMDALIARFGELPSPEDIVAHCMRVIDPENVSHYVWLDVKPKVGEHVDMSNVLVSIAPPKIFTPEMP